MNVIPLDEEAVFYVARRVEDPEAREAYLRQVCGGDAALRDRVDALLGVSEREASFLEVPPYDATADMVTPVESPGTVIGPYKLLEQIGEGGMGTVYMAEQSEPVRRRVAVKVIKPGMDTRQVVARFEAERQALAMMDHPNIAKVLDGGMTPSGRPYFVMELVRGLPITEYCDREQLSIPERLELFVLVCRAVQHAHQKGIIHRDLKPSNVLVTVVDGVPTPKVIDFGVAKATGSQLTDKTLFTGFHQFVGTPLYASPEQADLAGTDVDTRSDIYSLGVLLYELLTGTTPFDSETLRKAAFDEMRRIIREEEPPKPSTRLSTLGGRLSTVSDRRKADPRRLGSSMRGELDWIAMKALEKDRRRRYETANDFAADIMRYLTDRPVEACPPSARYRLGKFAWRNRRGLATTVFITGLFVTFACIAGTSQLRNASRLRRITQDVKQSLAGARTAIEAGNLALAGQRVAAAQGGLGADSGSIPQLVGEVDATRREIVARQADEDRFRRFLEGASNAQDRMSYDKNLGGDLLAEQALGSYGALTDKDWLFRLETSHLTVEQKQQIRETAYATLVSLADFGVRWVGQLENPKSAARSIELLERAQGFHQPTRAFYFVRANCRRLQGNTAAAAEDQKQFKAAAARTAWDYFLPGHTAGWGGDLDEAIRSYQAALGLQPNHYNSLFFLGMRLDTDKVKRPAEAIAYFTACIAFRPEHGAAHRNRGLCHLKLGHFDAAKADYEAALALAKNDEHRSLALVHSAELMYVMGTYQEEQELLRRVLAIEERLAGKVSDRPQFTKVNSQALANLAESLANCRMSQLRDPAQAVELARKAIERGRKDNRIWNTLGVAHYRTGDWTAAITALEKSEALDARKDLHAHDGYFLAMAHWQLGQKDRARQSYDKAAAWMEKHRPQNEELIDPRNRRADEELILLRAEAAALLGVNPPTEEAKPKPAPETNGPPG